MSVYQYFVAYYNKELLGCAYVFLHFCVEYVDQSPNNISEDFKNYYSLSSHKLCTLLIMYINLNITSGRTVKKFLPKNYVTI